MATTVGRNMNRIKTDFVLAGEIADSIAKHAIGQHIQYIKANIDRLKKKPKTAVSALDVGDSTLTLEALKIAFKYFGGTDDDGED